MLETIKSTLLEVQLSDLSEYLPSDDEAAEAELDYLDQSQWHGLASFTVEELKRDCPLVYALLDETTKLIYIDKIQIHC